MRQVVGLAGWVSELRGEAVRFLFPRRISDDVLPFTREPRPPPYPEQLDPVAASSPNAWHLLARVTAMLVLVVASRVGSSGNCCPDIQRLIDGI
ncbi:hypothetical protein E2C01_037132 [Portunus trituberculatus]|uniref:Uncharacterized protein n=1 Tax=Portunus trituberculatus TaxID=210409 RepID=A0A5B7FEH1_PORTR|nr:hypothetical protein [Portunus trituberculatus]